MDEYWIGIDGTDSPYGGCTTWTMGNVIDLLHELSTPVEFLSYPRLIRLNPNIPDKTRGNGALALHIRSNLTIDKLSDLITSQIITDQQHYELNPNKRPGLVISRRKPPNSLYFMALQELLTLESVLNNFQPDKIWPEPNQSHIGAIAAIASDLSYDFTFELLAYRFLENCGTERKISSNLIAEVAKQYQTVFSSFDFNQDRELIMPAGPDPVFCGIRGDDPHEIQSFFNQLDPEEQLSSYTIFMTNQATDIHVLSNNYSLNEYSVFSQRVQIIQKPREIRGGHIFCNARFLDDIVELAWFEPTKELRDSARNLVSGDNVYIAGSVHFVEVHDYPVIHVESMYIIDVEPEKIYHPPICDCGSRMTSAGSFAGYKCRNCSSREIFPGINLKDRNLFNGQRIYASKSAQRHLTRPKNRLHIRNRNVKTPDLSFRVHLD